MTTAVVTGSAGGIGSATLSAFEATGFTVHGIDVDDDPAAVFGALDRLVAIVCAHGVSGRALGDGPVDACTEEAWDAVLEANLRSVLLYCKHAIPLLRAAGGGRHRHGVVGPRHRGRRRGLRDPCLRGVEGRRDWSHPRDGDDLRQGQDPLQRPLPGTDRDADQPTRSGRSAHPRADRRAAAAHRHLRQPGRRRGGSCLPRHVAVVTGAVLTVDGGWTAR